MKPVRKYFNSHFWLLSYLLPYRRFFLSGIVALGFGGLLALAFPFLMGKLIGATTDPEQVTWNRNEVALALGSAVLTHAVVAYWRVIWFSKAGDFALADLRRNLFSHLVRVPVAFFDRNRVGELSSRMTADLSLIRNTVVFTLPQLIGQLIIFLGGVVLLFISSARLSFYLLGCVPLIIPVMSYFGNRMRVLSREAQDGFADTTVVVEETLQGISSVKTYSNEEFEDRRYGKAMKAYVDTIVRTARSRGLFLSSTFLILFATITLVAWIAGGTLERGEISIGEITQFALYSIFVGGVFISFPEAFGQLQRAVGATERVREIISEPLEEMNGTGALVSGSEPLSGELEIRDVRFRYPSRPESEVLRGVSLRIRPGERIAIVGPSGAGKSTLTALLMRLYLPNSGEVYYDGRTGDEWGSSYLRSQIAMVPQEVLLFGGTIYENIAYGKIGATREEVANAALCANAHEFIDQLPDGYQTIVGERGTELSGGQSQRIAIARAVLADPAILILDEATSSLDSETENFVQGALSDLMKNRTSIIIAHRLSTVRDADRIYVLESGLVVASGTHEELMKESELYQRLSRFQLSEGRFSGDSGDSTEVPGFGKRPPLKK